MNYECIYFICPICNSKMRLQETNNGNIAFQCFGKLDVEHHNNFVYTIYFSNNYVAESINIYGAPYKIIRMLQSNIMTYTFIYDEKHIELKSINLDFKNFADMSEEQFKNKIKNIYLIS